MNSPITCDLDPSVYERLRLRAAEHGRSIEDEALSILETALQEDKGLPERNLAEAIRARLEPLGGVDLELPPRRSQAHQTVGEQTTAPREAVDVYDLSRTCPACPSQWEGRVGEHGSIYIRYRWGVLSVHVSMSDGNAADMSPWFYDDDFGRRTGDRLDGYMATPEMRHALSGVCRFHGEQP